MPRETSRHLATTRMPLVRLLHMVKVYADFFFFFGVIIPPEQEHNLGELNTKHNFGELKCLRRRKRHFFDLLLTLSCSCVSLFASEARTPS